MNSQPNAQKKTAKAGFFVCRVLGEQFGNIHHLTFSCPLHEGLKATGADHHGFHAASCRVDETTLLEVWELSTLGFVVRVAHVITGERGCTQNCANLCHK